MSCVSSESSSREPSFLGVEETEEEIAITFTGVLETDETDDELILKSRVLLLVLILLFCAGSPPRTLLLTTDPRHDLTGTGKFSDHLRSRVFDGVLLGWEGRGGGKREDKATRSTPGDAGQIPGLSLSL